MTRRAGEGRVVGQRFQPFPQHGDLGPGEQVRQFFAELGVQAGEQPRHAVDDGGRQRAARPSPTGSSGACRRSGKHNPWSTPSTRPSGSGSTCEPLRSALLTTRSKPARVASAGRSACTSATGEPSSSTARNTGSHPAGTCSMLHQVDGLVRVGVLDPALHHARPERSGAQHRQRHAVPAGGPGHQVGGPFPVGQRAVREIPQRAFAADRLVDAGHRQPVGGRLGEQGDVRGVGEPAGDGDLPA